MQEETTTQVKKPAIIRSIKLALIYSLALGVVVFYFREPLLQKWRQFIDHASDHLEISLALQVMLSFSICHLVNAFSWMILIQDRKDFAFVDNLKSTCVYSMLINVFPIGTGHVIGVWFFHKYVVCTAKRLLFAWSLDQYIRGIVKVSSLVLFLSLIEPFGEIGDQMRTALFYFGSLIVLGALVILFCRRSIVVKTHWGRLIEKLGLKGDSVFEKKWLKTFCFAVFLRAFCWIFECLPVYFLCVALVPDYSLELVLSLFLSVKMATAYSISPGNFGVHEGVAYFVATAYGVSDEVAISLGVLYHLGFWLPTVVPGWTVALLAKRRVRFNSTKN